MRKGVIITSLILLLNINSIGQEKEAMELLNVNSIEELDKIASFHFIIMSDHRGEADNKTEFKHMVKWSKDSGAAFVLGVGDHIHKNSKNKFFRFLKGNKWWYDHFYPGIADGENSFYGSAQGEWGAGGQFLDFLHLSQREGVQIRKNGVEYYAKIQAEGYTVHLIQLHYPDEPRNPEVAFTMDSREYLIKTLDSINKGPKDILIAIAHSETGSWEQLLNDDAKKTLLEKSDLTVSATTHIFTRNVFKGYETKGALSLNSGSIAEPRGKQKPGYTEVHILENPPLLVVQYIDATEKHRKLRKDPLYCYAKLLNGGPIFTPPFAGH